MRKLPNILFLARSSYYLPRRGSVRFREYFKKLSEEGFKINWFSFQNDLKSGRYQYGSLLTETSISIPLFPLPARRILYTIYFFFVMLFLWPKPRPDIIIISGPEIPLAPIGIIYSRIFHIPLLIDWLDYDDLKSYQWRVVRYFFKICTSVMVISPFLKKVACSLTTKPVYYLPHPYFEESELLNNQNIVDLKKDDGHFYVGYAGTHMENQGVHILLRAAKNLIENDEIRFIIIGDAPHGYESYGYLIKQMVKDCNLTNVKLLGFISNRYDYLKEILKFDIAVIPKIKSIWNAACFPTKMNEIMGLGIPVIATKVGIPKKIIIDRYNGFLINTDDENQLADKILEAHKLQKSELYTIGLKGKETIKTVYSQVNLVLELKKIILNTIIQF